MLRMQMAGAPTPWGDITTIRIHPRYQNTRAHTVQGGYIWLWRAWKHTPTENTGWGQARYGVTKIH